MTDKRLTDNEIIKALMCFSFWHEGCEKCPYLKRCNKVKRMLTIIDTIDALALINRQQAEIERLNRDLDLVVRNYIEATKTAMQLARGKVIKEFVERLIADLVLLAKHEDEFRQGVILGVIHTVEEKKKEMVGDSDEN